MSKRHRIAPAHIPSSTYRVQLNRQFTFSQAAETVDYLDDLGVTDLYCSPFLMARPGSMHGYDITRHCSLNPEIGTREEFDKLSEELRERRMGWVQDIVPNHMA